MPFANILWCHLKFPCESTREEHAQKYWWRLTALIWVAVVVLIGGSNVSLWHNQSEVLSRPG